MFHQKHLNERFQHEETSFKIGLLVWSHYVSFLFANG